MGFLPDDRSNHLEAIELIPVGKENPDPQFLTYTQVSKDGINEQGPFVETAGNSCVSRSVILLPVFKR
jgi:hypothetical protein